MHPGDKEQALSLGHQVMDGASASSSSFHGLRDKSIIIKTTQIPHCVHILSLREDSQQPFIFSEFLQEIFHVENY